MKNILDYFTSIDDLLVALLERLGGVTEEDTHFFSYPNDGTRATITKGTTKLDFMAGTVMNPAGLVVTPGLGNSLRARGREYCRSLSLQADRDIIIQIGTKSKIPVFAGTWFKVAHLRFTDLKLIAAESTRIFVIACTNPDAIEMAGETYVKDPVDVWGKTATFGNAELAVRMHAPPLSFDRRGDVLRWEDFESAAFKSDIIPYNYPAYGTPTHGRSVDVSGSGDFTYRIGTTSNQTLDAYLYTNDTRKERSGVQTLFTSQSTNFIIQVKLIYFDGVNATRAYIVFNRSTDALTYYNAAGGYTTLDTVDYRNILPNFSTMKLVVDFDAGEYVRAVIFGTEYDMSGIELYAVGNASKKNLVGGTSIAGSDATIATVYIDNIILTENEPL